MRLNLGSGSRPLSGWLNVDIADTGKVDYVWDLDAPGHWPFVTPYKEGYQGSALDSDLAGKVDQIVAKDVFEHLADPIHFMVQCHRALRTGGQLFIRTPHYLHRDAFTDPTHKRFPTEHTFDYWIPGTLLFNEHNAAYGAVSFNRGHMAVGGGAIDITLIKV